MTSLRSNMSLRIRSGPKPQPLCPSPHPSISPHLYQEKPFWEKQQKIALDVSVKVQLISCVLLFVTPWTAAHQASPSITNTKACSNSCPLSRWCHPTISSSVIPFSSCLQSFPTSGSFPISQFFTSGGQSIGAFQL